MSTFGKGTDGASSSTSSADSKNATPGTPATSGTITSWTGRVWVSVGSSPFRAVLYADASGSPGALLAVTDDGTLTATSEGAVSLNFTGANQYVVTSGVPYWIACHWTDPGAGNFTWSRDNTSNVGYKNNDTWVGGASDPFGVGTPQIAGGIDYFITYTDTAAGTSSTIGHKLLLGVGQ